MFTDGIRPWTASGGGPQCANYGTPSKPPRLRGNLYVSSPIHGAGVAGGRFELPTDPDPVTFPLEACGLVTGPRPIGLGTDSYYGLMVYVPRGWRVANKAFFGVNIKEFHFQNIWAAPVIFQLHPRYVTLALETGACNPHTSSNPGCQYRSNAGHRRCTSTLFYRCLPGYYAIPPGAFVQGRWNEILMHVHWASNRTGEIQTWYRVMGATTWTPSAVVKGYPTVQWNVTTGCCDPKYVDETEAYTAALSAPLSVWLANDVSATSFRSVAAALP